MAFHHFHLCEPFKGEKLPFAFTQLPLADYKYSIFFSLASTIDENEATGNPLQLFLPLFQY